MSPLAGRLLGRDPMGYEGGYSCYLFVGSQPTKWLDPTGHSPLTVAKVVFSVLSIASSANTIRKNLDDKAPASWPTPFVNDYRIPSTFNFSGTPGRAGAKTDDCLCDSTTATIYDSQWCSWWGCDTYKIELSFSWCNGKIDGHTIATGQNALYRVAHVTESVNRHSHALLNRCGCFLEIPSVNVDFVIRQFVDQPWPIWDYQTADRAGFTACADGALSIH
jgi:hypothetical protein